MKNFIKIFVLFFAIWIVKPCSSFAQPGWIHQTSGTTSYLFRVCFTDSLFGAAAGTNGTVLQTTDGGAHWSEQRIGSGNDYVACVDYFDSMNGWISLSNGTIYRTSDGGTKWVRQVSGFTGTLDCIICIDTCHLWASGLDGTILFSSNGGRIWTKQESGTQVHLNEIYFSDSLHGTAVGGFVGGFVLLHTRDGGAHWTKQEPGTTQSLYSVYFTDSLCGIVVGAGGTILKTTNGGEAWTKIESGSVARLLDVDFSDSLHGTIVGDYGTILRTTDGGSSWNPQKSYTSSNLWGVDLFSTYCGTITGENGTILHTINGGIGSTQYFVTSADTIDLEADSNSISQLIVQADSAWQVINVPFRSWLGYTPVGGVGKDTLSVFSKSRNNTGKFRYGTMSLRSTYFEIKNVIVRQNYFSLYFQTSVENLELKAIEGDTCQLIVETDAEWQVLKDAGCDWFECIPAQGNGPGTISLLAKSGNESSSARNGGFILRSPLYNDKHITVSQATPVGNLTKSLIRLYSNPVRDILQIDGLGTLNGEQPRFIVYDMAGRVVRTITGITGNQIRVGDLTTGQYILEIRQGKQALATLKFIKD